MRIYSMRSPKGNPVPNQIVIDDDDEKVVILKSYDSLVAKLDKITGSVALMKEWNYSRTTTKYVIQFLQDYCYRFDCKTTADVRKAITEGSIEYIG